MRFDIVVSEPSSERVCVESFLRCQLAIPELVAIELKLRRVTRKSARAERFGWLAVYHQLYICALVWQLKGVYLFILFVEFFDDVRRILGAEAKRQFTVDARGSHNGFSCSSVG